MENKSIPVSLKHPIDSKLLESVEALAHLAVAEDIGTGDISQQLTPPSHRTVAKIIARQTGIYCGNLWIQALQKLPIFKLDSSTNYEDGDKLQPGDEILELRGNQQDILMLERTVLNGIQLLSGTATQSWAFSQAVSGYNCTILDTRKTLPGWRLAQKYAVRVGGASNHRSGLHDAYMIKENHLACIGSIPRLGEILEQNPIGGDIYIEVENLSEFKQALTLPVSRILLDNFSSKDTIKAVAINQKQNHPKPLEASGGMTLKNVREFAKTGVDYISVGALTKDLQSLDLSMQIVKD